MSLIGEIPSLRAEIDSSDAAGLIRLLDLRAQLRDRLKAVRHTSGDLFGAVRALQSYHEELTGCKQLLGSQCVFLWRLPWTGGGGRLTGRKTVVGKSRVYGAEGDEAATLTALCLLLTRAAEVDESEKHAIAYLKQAVSYAKRAATLQVSAKPCEGLPADICGDTLAAIACACAALLHRLIAEKALGMRDRSGMDAQALKSSTSTAAAAVHARSAAYAREQFGQAAQRAAALPLLAKWLQSQATRIEAMARLFQALELAAKNHIGTAEGLCAAAERLSADKQLSVLAAKLKELFQRENRLVSFETVPELGTGLPPLPSGRPVLDPPAWEPPNERELGSGTGAVSESSYY